MSARGRAKPLFDFDYTWEVYTPADKRRYGYYVLPVLWGDRLVARFDARMDRAGRTLVLIGLWLEDEALAGRRGVRDGLRARAWPASCVSSMRTGWTRQGSASRAIRARLAAGEG